MGGSNRLIVDQTSGRAVLVLFGGTLVLFALLVLIIDPIFRSVTLGLNVPNLNYDVSADSIYLQVPAWTDQSWRLYNWYVGLDLLYSLVRAFALIYFWAWLFCLAPTPLAEKFAGAGVLLLPLTLTITAWLENAGFFTLVFAHPVELPLMASLTGITQSARVLIGQFLVMLSLCFVMQTVWHRFRTPKLATAELHPEA